MISRKESKPGMSSSENLDAFSFVPAGWKLWALIFEAMASNDNAFKEKKPLETIDGIYVEDEYTFEEAISHLFYVTCNLVSRTFPVEIYDLKQPERVLDAIKQTAQRIHDGYINAQNNINSQEESVRKFAERVFDNCNHVLRILEIQRDKDIYHEAHDYDLEFFVTDYFFLNSDISPLHDYVNGRIIEEIDYNAFFNLVNLKSQETTVDGYYEDKEHQRGFVVTKEQVVDYSGIYIVPLPTYGMAMYALILKLMLGRNLYCSQIPEIYVETEFGDVMGCPDPKGWANSFVHYLKWKPEGYDIAEDLWKDFYFIGNRTQLCSGLTVNERNSLACLCSRSTCEDIISRDDIHNLLKHDNMTPDYQVYQLIYAHSKDLEWLKRLYSLVTKECCYLYDKGNIIEEGFMDDDACKGEQNRSEYRHQRKVLNEEEISTLFLTKTPDGSSIYRTLFERCYMADDLLWQQPIVSKELVSSYIKKCIVQDESLKLILFQSLYGHSFMESTNHEQEERISSEQTTDKDSDTTNNEVTEGKTDRFKDLRPNIINEHNWIMVSKAEFVRTLVENGYVTIGKDWKYVFTKSPSAQRYQELYSSDKLSYAEIGDEVLELTSKLKWSEFDKENFIFKGVKQKGKDLRKAFSEDYNPQEREGDANAKYKSRIKSIRELYAFIMRKHQISQ